MKSDLSLLIDFGSTYTKVSAIDLAGEMVIAKAEACTTVDTDIMDGLDEALEKIYSQLGTARVNFKHKLACSSAAGGLRIVAVGLVKDLTVEAARQAALGAGARVLGVYAHELTVNEVKEIEELKPEIVLLAGGTDGGNKEVILHNATMLAGSMITATVIVAGNKVVAGDVKQILALSGKEALITENVLPELDVLNVIPARQLIRQVFLDKIVEAKGLKRAEIFIDSILMPTPAAVQNAGYLLAKGTEAQPGMGDILIIDIGGATTDVHSMADGLPTRAGVSFKGLPQPYAKRTVEGDLGMRVSAKSLYEAVPPGVIEGSSGSSSEQVQQYVLDIHNDHSVMPRNEEEMRIESAMAVQCARLSILRHAGTLEVVWTPLGASYIQYGKDLTEIPYIIGTGGVVVNHPKPREILEGAIYKEEDIMALIPKDPEFLLDENYIFAAMGLLAEVEPELALRIMKGYLKKV